MQRALLCAVMVVLATRSAAADPPGFDPDAVYKIATGDGPHRGPDAAPITIVEWSDFSCRYCNRVNPTLEQLDRLYPGKVRWFYRHFPLDPDTTLAAEASLAAAAQGRFWPMHARLFAVHGQVDRPAVELIAADLGLDLNRFRAALDTGAYRAQVRADYEAAVALGVRSTPTFFINGRPVSGSLPLREFARIVDQELARAQAVPATAGRYEALVAAGRPAADTPDAAAAPFELDPATVYAIGLGLPGHATGPDDALVTIVEWSDFECPYCARNAPTIEAIRKDFAGQVRVIYRHLPLFFHAHADLAAEAGAEAAHQGKFWAFHDALFALGKVGRADLEAAGATAGLDLAQLRAALDDRRWREAVAADSAAGSIAGVTGTPTMFVNGQPVVGAVSYARLKPVVEAALTAARGLVARGVAPGDVYGVIMMAATEGEHGDPGRMPVMPSATLELGPTDREAAVVAACRGRDKDRADALAGKLAGAHHAAAAEACSAYGVDLVDP
ncbi:MAG: DsbA family protein [Deltaproteobacteria bacterium]|nr:DsbA family protein [Deltaproteobacteria bacterium]